MKVMRGLMAVGIILLGGVLLVSMSLVAIAGGPANGLAGTNMDCTMNKMQSENQAKQVSFASQENQSGDQGEVSIETMERFHNLLLFGDGPE